MNKPISCTVNTKNIKMCKQSQTEIESLSSLDLDKASNCERSATPISTVRESITSFPLDYNRKWNLRAVRKSTLKTGFHGYTYIIRFSEKNILKKYPIGPNYYIASKDVPHESHEWAFIRGDYIENKPTLVSMSTDEQIIARLVQQKIDVENLNKEQIELIKKYENNQLLEKKRMAAHARKNNLHELANKLENSDSKLDKKVIYNILNTEKNRKITNLENSMDIRIDQLQTSIVDTRQLIAYAGEQTMIGFPFKANINLSDNIRKSCIEKDPLVYNAYQSCINEECAKIVEYILEVHGHCVDVVSIDYPNITISVRNTALCRYYDENEAEQILNECLLDVRKNVNKNIKLEDTFVIYFASHIHGAYLASRSFYDFDNCESTIEVSECASNIELDLNSFFNMGNMPIHVKAKESMYKMPENMNMHELFDSKMFAHECFNSNKSFLYAFFDVDIKEVDVSKWTKSFVKKQIKHLHEELCGLFDVKDFKFSTSTAFRESKVSFHFISNSVVIGDIHQFKMRIANHIFTSLLGKNIDLNVYKNNGSLRLATKYKEQLVCLEPAPSVPGPKMHQINKKISKVTYDEDSQLKIFSNDHIYYHFITKLCTSDCILVCAPAYYMKSHNDNSLNYSSMNYRMIIEPTKMASREIKIDLIDKLIDLHFTYNNCFDDITKMFKFVSCVACVACGEAGSIGYQWTSYRDKLISKIENSIAKNITKKVENIKKIFEKAAINRCSHMKYNMYLDKLAETYGIKISTDIDLSHSLNIDVKSVNSKYLSQQDMNIDEFVHSKYQRLFIKSTMGTGKTEALFTFLRSRPSYIRVLIMCSRRSMVSEMKKRLEENNLEYLANSSDENFLVEIQQKPNCGIIVSTCESLYKIAKHIQRFDLIVCDEMEAIIDQMSSGETHRTKINENNHYLAKYIRNGKMIAMDGQLTENAIRMHAIPGMSMYIINKFTPDKNIQRAFDKEEFLQTMAVMQKEYKSIAVATDTRLACITLYEMFSGKEYDPKNLDEAYVVYNSDTSPFIDISTADLTNKTVIYTPSMDVSVSITSHTPDMIFGYFTNSQISSYCKSQMLMRFRNTKEVMIFDMCDFLKTNKSNEQMKRLLFDLEHERYADLAARESPTTSNILPNLKNMQNFTFNDIQNVYDRHILPLQTAKSNQSHADIYEYNTHKTLKRLARMNDLIRINNRPLYERDPEDKLDYSRMFNELYQLNSQKYTYGIYIEMILSEIIDRHQTDCVIRPQTSISESIYSTVEKYQWNTINKFSPQELHVKAAVSIIYSMSSYQDTHQYTSLEDFKNRFLAREHIIRLMIGLVQTRNRQLQLFLTYILRSIFLYSDGQYYIDMSYLQYICCSMALTYFKEIRETKVLYYTRKYLPSVGIMQNNPAPNLYPYVNIFANPENYSNFIQKCNNTVRDDDATFAKTTSQSSIFLSKFIHRISIPDLAKYSSSNNIQAQDVNLQFTVLARQNINDCQTRLVVLNFLKDSRRNEVCPNVYTSILYEYNGNKTQMINKILNERKKAYIVLRPIEIQKTSFLSREYIVSYIDKCVDMDLSMQKHIWKSQVYDMHELKATRVLSMLDTTLNELFSDHQQSTEFNNNLPIDLIVNRTIHEGAKDVYDTRDCLSTDNPSIQQTLSLDAENPVMQTQAPNAKQVDHNTKYTFDPLVLYKPRSKKIKKPTGFKTIHDIDDLKSKSIQEIQAGPQGIISQYRLKLLNSSLQSRQTSLTPGGAKETSCSDPLRDNPTPLDLTALPPIQTQSSLQDQLACLERRRSEEQLACLDRMEDPLLFDWMRYGPGLSTEVDQDPYQQLPDDYYEQECERLMKTYGKVSC